MLIEELEGNGDRLRDISGGEGVEICTVPENRSVECGLSGNQVTNDTKEPKIVW